MSVTRLLQPILISLLLITALPALAIDVERVRSPSGVEAWLVQDHSNPIITMRFAFRGGAALDPKGKAGLANLVASSIDEGAGDLDSQSFQQNLEDKAIRIRFDAGLDNFGGQLQTLARNRDEAFGLLRLALNALGLIPVLLGATWVHAGNGWQFSAEGGGWEFPLFWVAVQGAIALLGKGAYALRIPVLDRALGQFA